MRSFVSEITIWHGYLVAPERGRRYTAAAPITLPSQARDMKPADKHRRNQQDESD
jgi:hypothetical protein